MANPILIGGLLVGGTLAAWKVARKHQRRLRSILKHFDLPRRSDPDRPVPLELDPSTGVYRPVDAARRPRPD